MILEVKNISKRFGAVTAAENVSFSIEEGKTLALVGESGSGKSTVVRIILRLIEADSGQVLFDGENLFRLGPDVLRRKRSKMQIIFQDPYTSLNPRMRVGEIITEPLKVHGFTAGDIAQCRLLELVGLPSNYAKRYPHELSGGERQRVGIARALSVNPKFIIADEMVSSLDTTTQAQIINLLKRLKDELKLTLLFIAHDLAVVAQLCDDVAVMKEGVVVETGSKKNIYNNPVHQYTKKLLSSIAGADPTLSKLRKG